MGFVICRLVYTDSLLFFCSISYGFSSSIRILCRRKIPINCELIIIIFLSNRTRTVSLYSSVVQDSKNIHDSAQLHLFVFTEIPPRLGKVTLLCKLLTIWTNRSLNRKPRTGCFFHFLIRSNSIHAMDSGRPFDSWPPPSARYRYTGTTISTSSGRFSTSQNL